MDDHLEAYLFDEYPKFFQHADDGSDDVSSATDYPDITEIACESGWFPLIDAVARLISDRYNTHPDEPALHAVQIKEKFGGLRIYLNRRPEDISNAIRIARALSQTMCERCGATQGVRQQKRGGWIKTLCEPCGLDWRNVPDEVPVWQFTYDCHACNAETPVLYPVGVGGSHGGSWASVGDQLMEFDEGNVRPVFSEVQKALVYGNCCVECGTYQGNYYVYKAAKNRGLTALSGDSQSDTAVKMGRVTLTRQRSVNR